MTLWVRWLGYAFVAAAVLAACVSAIPADVLREIFGTIRRPEDVTAERILRFRQLCVFLFLVAGAWGGWLIAWPDSVKQFVCGLFQPASRAISQPITSRVEIWLILVVCAVGISLRWQRLDSPLAYDEAYSYTNFASRPWYIAIADFNSTNNHLLNTFIMHWSTRLFGVHEWSIRLGVFTCGIALLPAVAAWAWRRLGPTVALVTTSLIAIAPALITYSVDARGYLYITLAAVILDHALAARVLSTAATNRTWLQAWLATVLGGWTMIIMAYHVFGCWLWYITFAPADSLGQRLRQAVAFAFWSLPIVLLFYLPSYMFRGLLFARDPIMIDRPTHDYFWASVTSWQNAFQWWAAGVMPGWLWLICIVVGVVIIFRQQRWLGWALVSPFIAVLILNVLQNVSPPPRLYLSLMPWVCLAAAVGAVWLFERVISQRVAGVLLALVITILGGWHASQTTVLIDPADRMYYQSVPDAIELLGQLVRDEPDRRHRLLAPLPTDHPALYYCERRGLDLPINGQPQAGEMVWLLSGNDVPPGDTLRNMVIRLSDQADRYTEWQPVAEFAVLTLYRAEYLPPTN